MNMNERKFSELLFSNYSWRIIFDGKFYKKEDFLSCLLFNLDQWTQGGIVFKPESYVVCVGFNSLHYIFYTFLASLLGHKIIFATTHQVATLYDYYPGLDIQFILSPRAIKYKQWPCILIDLNNFDYSQSLALDRLIVQDEQAKIVFCTSGTTGKSKLVMYQESKLLNNADMVGNYFNFSDKDICLCVFPANYMYGFSMSLSMLLKNGTVILERSTVSPIKIVDYLLKDNISVFPILRELIDKIMPLIVEGNYYFSNLTVINAADKIFKMHVMKILKFAPIFWNNFGQTEAGPRLFAVRLAEINAIDSNCYNEVMAIGFTVHPDIVIEIRDERGMLVSPGEIGELYYRTPFAMDGYLSEEGNLLPCIGWLRSGDLVYQNQSGLLYWAGRKSQTVKINGSFVNINLLTHHFDDIEEIKQAFFIYDEETNQIYGFFKAYSDIDKSKIKQKIITQFKLQFPQYPRLSQIHLIDELPKTVTGKIDLKSLKTLAASCYEYLS